jgi:hypothetical protein
MKNQLFEISIDQKKLVQEISSICGIKQETILQIWKYTLLLNYLTLIEKKESRINVLNIPLVGKILASIKEDGELEVSAYLTEALQETIKKIKNGDDTEVIKYFTQEFIDPVVAEICENN